MPLDFKINYRSGWSVCFLFNFLVATVTLSVSAQERLPSTSFNDWSVWQQNDSEKGSYCTVAGGLSSLRAEGIDFIDTLSPAIIFTIYTKPTPKESFAVSIGKNWAPLSVLSLRTNNGDAFTLRGGPVDFYPETQLQQENIITALRKSSLAITRTETKIDAYVEEKWDLKGFSDAWTSAQQSCHPFIFSTLVFSQYGFPALATVFAMFLFLIGIFFFVRYKLGDTLKFSSFLNIHDFWKLSTQPQPTSATSTPQQDGHSSPIAPAPVPAQTAPEQPQAERFNQLSTVPAPAEPAPQIYETLPPQQGMFLKLKRTQKQGFSGPIYMLDARLDASQDILSIIYSHNLGSRLIYESESRQRHQESAQEHLEDSHDDTNLFAPPSQQAMGVAKMFWKLGRAAVSAARASFSLRITVDSLLAGVHVECKSMDELLEAEDAIREAKQNLEGYISSAKSFDGHEEIL